VVFILLSSIQRDTSQFDYLDSSVIKMMLLQNKKVRRYMSKLAKAMLMVAN
jgi:hypothetical protein